MIEVKKLLSAKDALTLSLANKASGTGLGSENSNITSYLDIENNCIIHNDISYPIKEIHKKKDSEVYKTKIGKFIRK